MIRKGRIQGFYGSWGSGLATLEIQDDETGQIEEIPCDNTATVRVLDAAFGGVIADGYAIDLQAIKGKCVYWGWDDFGLCLGWILPADQADAEFREAYRRQRRGKKEIAV